MLALYALITLLWGANAEWLNGPSKSEQMASKEQCSGTTETNERELAFTEDIFMGHVLH